MGFEEIVEGVAYEITGPGYTIVEYAMITEPVDSNPAYTRSSRPSQATPTTLSYDPTGVLSEYNTPSPTSQTTTGGYNRYPYAYPSDSAAYTVSYPSDYNYTYPSNYTSTNTSSISSNLTESSAEQAESSGEAIPNDNHPPAATILKGVLSTIGALAVIMTIWFCYRRAKVRQREKRGEEGKSVSRDIEQVQPSTFRQDPFDITPIPPPPPVRYSQIPPPAFFTRGTALPSIHRHNGRDGRASVGSSSWADDSEIDALATDGSSLARTISTYSSTGSISSDRTVRIGGEDNPNPFDHPAYTLIPSRQRPLLGGMAAQSGTLPAVSITQNPIRQGQISPQAGLGAVSPFSSGNPAPTPDPFADPSPSPIDLSSTLSSQTLPTSPSSSTPPLTSIPLTVPSTPTRSHNQTYTEIFETNSTPLTRGTTFIHHIDGGRAPYQRAGGAPEPDRVGGGEVHIPPTYMELYPRR